ncbi:hypothetical protein RchiOBHm_Chr4g0410391 [Rosa chinensis]|uniref:Uncharacterized protein n=1 Tax=Rosa chinensis TaxID=74649 RepID=A0A2P6QVD4_ROSCH|nr:hypothetical protein RchiOBHm_Chr4g0410391 [Rosa chinensis]
MRENRSSKSFWVFRSMMNKWNFGELEFGFCSGTFLTSVCILSLY